MRDSTTLHFDDERERFYRRCIAFFTSARPAPRSLSYERWSAISFLQQRRHDISPLRAACREMTPPFRDEKYASFSYQ